MTNKLLVEAQRFCQQQLTKHPEFNNYLHWSFIVQDNKIVEWGVNRTGEPPKQWGYGPNSKLHSELSAYKKARLLLNRGPFSVINVRLNRQGQVKMSAPCEVCTGWLKYLGCVKVYFTTPAGWASLVP